MKLQIIALLRTTRTAANALRRNQMRAALTALGIIIGIGAVISVTEIGQGSSAAMQKTIASMGANNLLIFPGPAKSGGVSSGAGGALTLTPDDAEAIQRECPGVRTVASIVGARTQVVYGGKNYVPGYVLGVTPSYLEVRDWTPVAEGETFDEHDVLSVNKVCLLGHTVVRELFEGESPVGKDVRIRDVSFRVIGVLAAKGANSSGQDQDDMVLAPWTTVKYRVSNSSLQVANQSAASAAASGINSLNGRYPGSGGGLYPQASAMQVVDTPLPVRFTNVDAIQASTWSAADMPLAISQITALLRERHRLHGRDLDDFRIINLTEIAQVQASFSEQMKALMVALAAISLVVGGVGIMNIMLVSVTERTREIGLRMAVGARSRDILRQFLTEAIVMCLAGGVVGIGVGRVTSLIVTHLKQWPSQPSIGAVLMSVAVSAGVGIIFGFYPAWKASRLNPIDALRYE